MSAASHKSKDSYVYGLAEVYSWSLAFLLADKACNHSSVEIFGMESTGGDSVLTKFLGSQSNINEALNKISSEAVELGITAVVSSFIRPTSSLIHVIQEPNQIDPLYGHRQQFLNTDYNKGNPTMNAPQKAIGILETQGLTASLHAADVMLKTSDVTLIGKEKIGAAYVTIIVQGDVAAVSAAIAAGANSIKDLGKLVAAHTIARPHPDMLALLPQKII